MRLELREVKHSLVNRSWTQFKNYDNVIETEININDEVIFRDNNKHKYSEGMGSIFLEMKQKTLQLVFQVGLRVQGFIRMWGMVLI